eukprot:1393682-Amorphochlora_amoeboformis.AAC.2
MARLLSLSLCPTHIPLSLPRSLCAYFHLFSLSLSSRSLSLSLSHCIVLHWPTQKVAKKEQRRAKAKKPLNEDEDDIDAILA